MALRIRLLIDECLSPALEKVAHDRGLEALHVNHRGYSGRTDDDVFALMQQGTYTLVTNNHSDFAKLVGRVELHPGLIVLTENVRREQQIAMLEAVLVHLVDQAVDDLVNRVVEVDSTLAVHLYEFPSVE